MPEFTVGSVRDLWADGRPNRPPRRWQARIGWRKTRSFKTHEEAVAWLNSQTSPAQLPPNLWVPWGEVAYDNDGRFVCHLCGGAFGLMAGHLRCHDMTAQDYRRLVGLSGRQALCSRGVSEERKMRAIKGDYGERLGAFEPPPPDYSDAHTRRVQSFKSKRWAADA